MFRIEGTIEFKGKPHAEVDDMKLQLPMNFTHVVKAAKLLDFRNTMLR